VDGEPPLLLDTCAVIWIANGDSIAEQASDALNDAAERGRPVYVSPISAWEVGLLAARGRITLPITPLRWFLRLLDVPGVRLSDMSPSVLIASSYLPGNAPRDPADRIVAATSRELGYRVVTRDHLLLEYADAGHLQVLAC
jgi:PIN domain nuclease of toxin-antitoxin system